MPGAVTVAVGSFFAHAFRPHIPARFRTFPHICCALMLWVGSFFTAVF